VECEGCEIGAEEVEPCTVERGGDSSSAYAILDGLESAEEIQWSVSTTFEKWSDSELTTCGFDYAADEGFQTTVLKEA